MKRYVRAVTMAGLLAGSCVFAHAAEPMRPSGPAQLTLPPNSPPPMKTPAEEQPIPCDLRASPDYVSGIDVQGREVAPADVPSRPQVEISTEMFVATRPKIPQLRGMGMIVNLPGLGAPACVPLEGKSPK